MPMGKNSRSPLSQCCNPVPVTFKEPEQQPEATVRKLSNGGFLVVTMGKEGYSSRSEGAYETFEKAMEAAEKHFGGKKEEG